MFVIIAGSVHSLLHTQHIVLGFFSFITDYVSLALLRHCLTDKPFPGSEIIGEFISIVFLIAIVDNGFSLHHSQTIGYTAGKNGGAIHAYTHIISLFEVYLFVTQICFSVQKTGAITHKHNRVGGCVSNFGINLIGA